MVLGFPAFVMLLAVSFAGAAAEALRATCGVIGRGWKVCPAVEVRGASSDFP